MEDFFDINLFQQVFNSNEFKGWLLSKRWFGDKVSLSNLDFKISITYFEIITNQILLTVIQITTDTYEKRYFLPLIYYDKIQDILLSRENNRKNIVKLTEITYSKMVALNVHDKQEQQIFSLNLVEAEHCAVFWKNLLFDKNISEKFPQLSLDLTLYTDQFADNVNMAKVQSLIEASLYPDRYEYNIKQIAGGNTTNSLFLLRIYNKNKPDHKAVTFVLKSYKEFSESLEPKTLYILVKNNFPNSPKIYGSIKLQEKEVIGILENLPNIGNLGDIYWNELDQMVSEIFPRIDYDYTYLQDKATCSDIIKKYCHQTLKVSEEIGIQIKNLHRALISEEDPLYSIENVQSEEYLSTYTEKLISLVDNIQENMSKRNEGAFYNSPKIMSILLDIKDIIEKFRTDFNNETIKIQPVHQGLHMQQILYNKQNEHYKYYFVDFDGDPQLKYKDRLSKFPIEKDLGSFLRSLSYIKFNAIKL